jgi:hypothetical protein
VTSVVLAGQDDAVAHAVAALGPEGLAAVLPYLQPSVLTPRHRRQIDEADLDLDDLRAAAATAVGESPPPPSCSSSDASRSDRSSASCCRRSR